MARLLVGVTGGIAAYKAVELVAAGRQGRAQRARRQTPAATALRRARRPSPASPARRCSSDALERDPAAAPSPTSRRPTHDPISHLALVEQRRRVPDRPGLGQHARQARRTAWPTTC